MEYILLTSMLAFFSCATPPPSYPYFRTGEVICVKNDARLVTLSSIYHAGNAVEAQKYAERNVIENLLFKGIAGCYDVPLIPDEQKSIQEHKAFYDWLVTQREYERFVTDRTMSSTSAGKNGVSVTETITIDVPALRKEMEKQGVVKKFGF